MNVSDKIRFFYDSVKINGAHEPVSIKIPLSVAIPAAAAISVVLGAALVLPGLQKKPAVKKQKKPIKGV